MTKGRPSVPSPEEERKEIRGQRHDFIKEYYKMAATDLDRHLKGGWQTIAILAGGAAILTAGHDQKIGLPIAALIALGTACWGMLNIIDANYWSLRAIAFLSNVEAIYFSAEDRKVFHPYIGYFPRFKLMNSLLYLFWLSFGFGCATILTVIWELASKYDTVTAMWERAWSLPWLKFALWTLPFVAAPWVWFLVKQVEFKRLCDYTSFVTSTPGPRLRLHTTELRHVTLEPVSGEAFITTETNTHSSTLEALRAKQVQLKDSVLPVLRVLVFLVTAAYLLAVLIRAFTH
jgi:hypothetical protein